MSIEQQPTTFFWFRRDLRLEDNHGLYQALSHTKNVQCLFIFDSNILEDLEDKQDARVNFIYDSLRAIDEKLQSFGASLLVEHGHPIEVWKRLLKQYSIDAIYCNRDYEPYAKERDASVQALAAKNNALFQSFKDQVILEELEVTKADGKPYTVFTPYSRKWKAILKERKEELFSNYDISALTNHFAEATYDFPSLATIGFEQNTTIKVPSTVVAQKIIKEYDQNRNFPAVKGTSRLGVHFRFGTISIRRKAEKAEKLNATYLNELIWRDFYAMILANFPQVVSRAFRTKYDNIAWRNNETEFEAWKNGKTGYPMVDAGMRELNATGYMHNRVRMVVASFLCKHLLIDWRWGEAYFAEKLLDFDLASNSGGWQWAAGCGTDAAPYFRIFNPTSQMDKFDKDKRYVKKWVPEYGTDKYLEPIVEHKMARERCLEVYKAAVANQ